MAQRMAEAVVASSARDPPERIFEGHVFSVGPSPRHATIINVITTRGGTIYDPAQTPDEAEPLHLIRYAP